MYDGKNPPPSLREAVVAAVQERLDRFAQEHGYDSILSACSYASSTSARFKTEADYCVAKRDEHWNTCIQLESLLTEVATGARPEPTIDEVMALMPPLSWPT